MAQEQRPTLEVTERAERGSRAIRKLRRAGVVPGVLYGGGNGESVALSMGSRELRNLLHGGAALLDLKLNGDKRPVIVKEQQKHPVRDDVLHIDFLQVRLDEKIQSTVPIELENIEEAPGVKEGGVVGHVTRELNIEALPTDIPERITVDVSGMEAAATKMLNEIRAPQGVTFLDDPDETVIATITVPTEIEEPEVEEETELVGEDGEPLAEGEEPPEGEAAEGEEQPAEGESGGESPGDSGDSGGDKS